MVGRRFKYNVTCPKCGCDITHESYGDMSSFRYNRDEVVEERCTKCKAKFLVVLESNSIITKYSTKDLCPILY